MRSNFDATDTSHGTPQCIGFVSWFDVRCVDSDPRRTNPHTYTSENDRRMTYDALAPERSKPQHHTHALTGSTRPGTQRRSVIWRHTYCMYTRSAPATK